MYYFVKPMTTVLSDGWVFNPIRRFLLSVSSQHSLLLCEFGIKNGKFWEFSSNLETVETVGRLKAVKVAVKRTIFWSKLMSFWSVWLRMGQLSLWGLNHDYLCNKIIRLWHTACRKNVIVVGVIITQYFTPFLSSFNGTSCKPKHPNISNTYIGRFWLHISICTHEANLTNITFLLITN